MLGGFLRNLTAKDFDYSSGSDVSESEQDATEMVDTPSASNLSAQAPKRERRHVYQGFRARVARIDVSPFLPTSVALASSSSTSASERPDIIAPGTTAPEGAESFFAMALERWCEFDGTAAFGSAYGELHKLAQSLPLLLFNRAQVVDILLKHLAEPATPARRSLLDLLTHLARDLRGEFYPFFKPVVIFLAGSLLDPRDASNIEEVFTTLSYLFKFCQRQLLADIHSVLGWYAASLLAHKKPFVRKFAAESAGFLLRKVPEAEVPAVVDTLFTVLLGVPHTDNMDDNASESDDDYDVSDDDDDTNIIGASAEDVTPSAGQGVVLSTEEQKKRDKKIQRRVRRVTRTQALADGISMILAETVRGSRGRFAFCMTRYMNAVIEYLVNGRAIRSEDKAGRALSLLVLWETTHNMHLHVRNTPKNSEFWPILQSHAEKLCTSGAVTGKDERASVARDTLEAIVAIAAEWSEWRGGAGVPRAIAAKVCANIADKILKKDVFACASNSLRKQVLRLVLCVVLLEDSIRDTEDEVGENGVKFVRKSNTLFGQALKLVEEELAEEKTIEKGIETLRHVLGLALSVSSIDGALYAEISKLHVVTFITRIFGNNMTKSPKKTAAPITNTAILQVESIVLAFLSQLSAELSATVGIAPEVAITDKTVLSWLSRILTVPIDTLSVQPARVWSVMRIVPLTKGIDVATVRKFTTEVINLAISGTDAEDANVKCAQMMAFDAFHALKHILDSEKDVDDLLETCFALVRAQPEDERALEACQELLNTYSANDTLSETQKTYIRSKFGDMCALLQENALSPSKGLRRQTAAFLEQIAPDEACSTLLGLAVIIEDTPIDVQHLREITTRIEMFERKARARTLPEAITGFVVRYLFGTYYIKFRPVWDATTKALRVVIGTNFAVGWPILMKVLEHTEHEIYEIWFPDIASKQLTDNDEESNDEKKEHVGGDDKESENNDAAAEEMTHIPDTEELAENDVPTKKLKKTAVDDEIDDAVDVCVPEQMAKEDAVTFESLEDQYEERTTRHEVTRLERTDEDVFNGLIWGLVQSFADRAQNDPQAVVQGFLLFLCVAQPHIIVTMPMNIRKELMRLCSAMKTSTEADRLRKNSLARVSSKGLDQDNKSGGGAEDKDTQIPFKNLTEKLCSFLVLFTKMPHPEKLAEQAFIYSVLEHLVESSDRHTQELALNAIFQFHRPAFASHTAPLSKLATAASAADATARFQVFSIGTVARAHRHEVSVLAMHILYPRLFKASHIHGRSTGSRTATLAYFANYNTEADLKAVVDRILYPLEHREDDFSDVLLDGSLVKTREPESVDNEGLVIDNRAQTHLRIVTEFVDQLSTRCEPFIGRLLSLLGPYSTTTSRARYASSVRQTAFQALTSVFSLFTDNEQSSEKKGFGKAGVEEVRNFLERASPVIMKSLGASKCASPPAVFGCLLAMSDADILLSLLAENPEIYPGIASYISSTRTPLDMRGEALQFVERVAAAMDRLPAAKKMIQDNVATTTKALCLLLTQKNSVAMKYRGNGKKSSKNGGSEAVGGTTQHDHADINDMKKRAIVLLETIVPMIKSAKDATDTANALLRHAAALCMGPSSAINAVQIAKGGRTNFDGTSGVVIEETVNSLLGLVENLLRKANSKTPTFVAYLGGLFGTIQLHSARRVLCRMYQYATEGDDHMRDVADLVGEINAYARGSVNCEYDYDRRQAAIDRLLRLGSEEKEAGADEKPRLVLRDRAQFAPIVTNLLFYATDEDRLIREGALAAMKAVLKEISTLVSDEDFKELEEEMKKTDETKIEPNDNNEMTDSGDKNDEKEEDDEEEDVDDENNDENEDEDGMEEGEENEEETSKTKKEIKKERASRKDLAKYVRDNIVPQVVRGVMKSQDSSVVASLHILKQLGEVFPSVYPDLAELGRGKASFLDAYGDISCERRARGLASFCAVGRAGKLDAGRCEHVWLPLLSKHLLAEHSGVFQRGQSKKKGQREMMLFRTSMYHQLNKAQMAGPMAKAIAACHAAFAWPQYYSSLNSFVSVVDKEPELAELVTPVICAIIDAFHFAVTEDQPPVDVVALRKQIAEEYRRSRSGLGRDITGEEDEKRKEDGDGSDEETGDEGENDEAMVGEDALETMMIDRELSERLEKLRADQPEPVQVRMALTNRLIPLVLDKLRASREAVLGQGRQLLARAAVRLVLLLPGNSMNAADEVNTERNGFITQLLTMLCQGLRTKEEDVRIETRSALIDVCTRLGLPYYASVFSYLCTALRRGGFHLHVLGYTLNGVLRAVSDAKQFHSPEAIESLATVAQDTSEVLLDDIMGLPGRQKRSPELRGKTVEMGDSTAVESYTYLAKMVGIGAPSEDFGGAGKVLVPVITAARTFVAQNTGLSPKEVTDYLRDILRRGIASGLLVNANASLEKLLPFAYLLVKSNMQPRDARLSQSALHGARAARAKKLSRRGNRNAVHTVIAPDSVEVTMDPREEAELNARKRFLVEAKPSPNRPADSVVSENTSLGFLLAEFGLELVDALIARKDGRINWSDHEQLERVDPFISILVTCLNDRNPSVANTSLRVFTHLLVPRGTTTTTEVAQSKEDTNEEDSANNDTNKKDAVVKETFTIIPTLKLLPSLEKLADNVVRNTMALIDANTLSNSKSAQETFICGFDLVTVLLRSAPDAARAKLDLHIPRLVKQVGACLSKENVLIPELCRACFNLLDVVISRKVQCPEVYDIIDRITVLSVTTGVDNARVRASKLVSKFLATYPQSDKRRTQTLDFYIKNLDYETVPGRLAVVSVLDSTVSVLPEKETDERAEALFLALVARFYNEDDQDVKTATTKALKNLFRAVSDRRAAALLTLTLGWLRNTADTDMQRVALQIYTLFAEVGGPHYWRKFLPALPHIMRVMKEGTELMQDERKHGIADLDAEPANWMLLYHSLLAIEKVLAACPTFVNYRAETETGSYLDSQFWTNVCELGGFRHAWVQFVSLRLVGQLFSRNTPDAVANAICENKKEKKEEKEKEDAKPVTDFISSRRHVTMLEEMFVNHLKEGRTSPQCAEQLLRNLVFLARVYISLGSSEHTVSSQTKKAKKAGKANTDALPRLVSSCTALMAEMPVSLRICVFKLFAAIATLIPNASGANEDDSEGDCPAMLATLLPSMVEPLYCSVNNIPHGTKTGLKEASSSHTTRKDEKDLANEVLSVVKQAAGDKSYLHAYNAVREKFAAQIKSQALQRKQLAVIDPAKNSDMKLRSATDSLHKLNEKQFTRKIAKVRMLRKTGQLLKVRGGVDLTRRNERLEKLRKAVHQQYVLNKKKKRAHVKTSYID